MEELENDDASEGRVFGEKNQHAQEHPDPTNPAESELVSSWGSGKRGMGRGGGSQSLGGGCVWLCPGGHTSGNICEVSASSTGEDSAWIWRTQRGGDSGGRSTLDGGFWPEL